MSTKPDATKNPLDQPKPCTGDKKIFAGLSLGGAGWFAASLALVIYKTNDVMNTKKLTMGDGVNILFAIALVGLMCWLGYWIIINPDFMNQKCVNGFLDTGGSIGKQGGFVAGGIGGWILLVLLAITGVYKLNTIGD